MLGGAIVVVALTTLFLTLLIAISDWDNKAYFIIPALFLYTLMCVVFIRGEIEGDYDQGQIDALHGIQTFEVHYVYPEGDTIPCDTLYLKIEE